jgi:hypothetical protein
MSLLINAFVISVVSLIKLSTKHSQQLLLISISLLMILPLQQQLCISLLQFMIANEPAVVNNARLKINKSEKIFI